MMGAVSAVRGPRRLAILVIVLLLFASAFPVMAGARTPRTLTPTGGGYETPSLEEFGRIVGEHADGPSVDILVVPSSYGDDPADREENIELAGERTQQIEDACDAVVDLGQFPQGCDATLLILFDRSDAQDFRNSLAFYSKATDGAYILGGDQDIAMHVLARTPAELAMTIAYGQGVVFGGTSAGAAVQSTNMIAGYTEEGWPYNALEKPMVLIWWANDGDDERGLLFGSNKIIFGQHFYQRGRFTRLLNIVAQSDEQYKGKSKLGVGVDYATSVVLTDDAVMSDVAGASSIAIVDGEQLGATFNWVGPRETLSARNLLTHVVAPDAGITYNVNPRQLKVEGSALPVFPVVRWDRALLANPANGTLILGGDVSLDWAGPAVQELVSRVEGTGKIVVVATPGLAAGDAQALADEYVAGLESAGLSGRQFETIVYDEQSWQDATIASLDGAAAVIFVGGDQSQLAGPIGDAAFQSFVRAVLATTPVVMTDGTMTAAMGAWYSANPAPTDDDYQEVGIASFLSGNIDVQPGLGIIAGASFEPRLTWDQRWGRLYSLARAHPDTMVFGLSEITALVLEDSGAHVAGERSVVALDGRRATFRDGTNGAFSALNVVMDIFSVGDEVMK